MQTEFESSSAQRKMWLVSQHPDSSISYNITSCYLIRGELEIHRLESAFRATIDRHEGLRAQFFIREEGLRQRIYELSASRVDLESVELDLDVGHIGRGVHSIQAVNRRDPAGKKRP